jgi:hypothetical protein
MEISVAGALPDLYDVLVRILVFIALRGFNQLLKIADVNQNVIFFEGCKLF